MAVAIIGLLIGLSAGYGLGSRRAAPSADSHPTETASHTGDTPDQLTYPNFFVFTAPPMLEMTPPSDGLTLTQALDALNEAGYDARSGAVSARLVPASELSVDLGTWLGEWAWVFTWNVDAEMCAAFGGGIELLTPGPSTLPEAVPTERACLELAAVDYKTGQFLFAMLPASGW
jgi:hypothetical protein